MRRDERDARRRPGAEGLSALLIAACLLVAACTGSGGPPAATPRPAAPSTAAPAAPAGTPAAATPPVTAAATTAAPVSLGKVVAATTIASAGMMPLWMADEAGLWQRHGLEVDLTLISGMPPAMAALIAGEIQFAHSAGESALSAQAREPAIVGVLNWNRQPAQRFLVRGDIERPDDLRGKRIGVFTLGDGNYVQWGKALTKWGLDPQRDVVYTAVGGGGQGGFIAAMAAGAIDGAIFLPPNDLPALKNGARVLAEMADLGLPNGGFLTYTLRPTLDHRRPAVEAYLKGIVDGIRLFKSDARLAKEVLARRTGITDAEAIDVAYEAYRGDRTADQPLIDLAMMRQVLEDSAAENPDVRAVQVERAFDNSVLQALAAQGYFNQR